jgi:hypothetical protein
VNRASVRMVVLFVLCVLGFGRCEADELAAVTGLVTDPHGRSVPGVKITITNLGTNVESATTTNEQGIYTVPGLQPGIYRITLLKDGFKSIVKSGVELHVQDVASINFELQLGSVNETVTVQAGGINVNTTDAAVSTVIDRQFVANMPLNGRSLQDLMELVPGAAMVGNLGNGGNTGPGEGGEITVNGQRTEGNYFSVDGVSSNVGTEPGSLGGVGFAGGVGAETALGTTQSMVSVDALEEFRATTSTYSAEYGRTPGGQFSFTTRSGTNDWHGSAFDYFRNEALDANNWFNNASNPQVPRQKERQNDFGGTLGAPIRIPHFYNGKDKTFFFFAYEGLRLWTPLGVVTQLVPDQALRQEAPAALQPILTAFPLPNKGEDGLNNGLGIYEVGRSNPSSIDSVSLRIDENVGDKLKIFGRYARTPSNYSGYYLAIKENSVINNELLTLGSTSLLTPSQSNEFRFNVTWANSNSANVSTNYGGATPFDISTLPGPNGSNLSFNGSLLYLCLCYSSGPVLNLGAQTDAQRQYNLTDSYSWTLGRHSVKFGVDWRRLATYARPILAEEFAEFTTEADVLANSPTSISAFSKSPAPVEPLYTNFSVFAQDEWKVTAKWSVSLGLRWDVNPAPTNLTGPSPYTLNQITNLNTASLAPAGTPLWNTDWRGLAPRFGTAYELRQTPGGETVLRAGFGIFYDLGNIVGSNGFGAIGFQSQAAYANASFPLSSAQMTLPPPSVASPYNAVVQAFDPNLKLPYTLEWNVALEQALGNRQALTVSYVGSGGRKLLETYYLNPTSPDFSLDNGVYVTKNGSTSDYNALQVQFQRKLSSGLQALASYTFSHSIDDASSNFYLYDLQERASSDFDIRHNFQAALTYDVPGRYSNGILSGLLSRWALDARITAHSALPVDVLGNYFTDPNTLASVLFHPNIVPNQPLYVYGSQYPGGRIINYNAFIVPTSGPGYDSEGDTPRNYARGFGAWQLNLAVRREFPIYERLHLQFRVEAFNLFNHPAFSSIPNNWTDGPYNPQTLFGFGGATGTSNFALGGLNPLYQTGGPRSLQIALKLIF